MTRHVPLSTLSERQLKLFKGKIDPHDAGSAWVQGMVTWLWSSVVNQQIQFEVAKAATLYELNPGGGYSDSADIIKGCTFAKSQIIVVYNTTANSDGSYPVVQVASTS
jgi:hypothetical protein